MDGKELLYFSGTSYLGMSRNPEFQQFLLEGIQQYGSNYSSSRASNLQLAVYEEAEQLLATLTGADAALTFSSGYLAGQAVINAINAGQTFIYAPETHPAMWRRKSDRNHGSYKTWTLALPAKVAAVEAQETVIVSNSLDPLMAEKYRFDWVGHLPEDKRILLVIDDSHGFGITGRTGAGIYPELKGLLKPNVELVVVSSFAKAYGVPGGVVFGSCGFINLLKQSSFFTAGSPIAPAYLYAFIHAQAIYKRERKRLFGNVAYFQQLIKDTGIFRYFDDYPVFYTKENKLYDALNQDCLLSSFPYPDPGSDPITRVIINSLHQREDIQFLAGKIEVYAASGYAETREQKK